MSASKLHINIDSSVSEIISQYCYDGRGANKILVDAFAIALNESGKLVQVVEVKPGHVYEAIQNSRLSTCCIQRATNETEVGKIFGIGAFAYQGRLIELEAVAFPAERPGEGSIRFNETAGSMAKDSVFNAASVLRQDSGEKLKDYDLHINFIGGGKVDGPSAGAAIYLAILSAIKKKPIRQDVAITGELALQGKVKAIGALHEKIYGARQAGIKKMLIPAENSKDIAQSPPGMEIIPIKYISEAYQYVFAD